MKGPRKLCNGEYQGRVQLTVTIRSYEGRQRHSTVSYMDNQNMSHLLLYLLCKHGGIKDFIPSQFKQRGHHSGRAVEDVARSDAGLVGSNPTQCMDACVRLFGLCRSVRR
jgi:hypothetical protein